MVLGLFFLFFDADLRGLIWFFLIFSIYYLRYLK